MEDPAEEVICRGVQSFDLRYFDGVDWQDKWDSAAQGNVLPRAVEVTLELVPAVDANEDEKGPWVCRVFQIPCSSLRAGLQVETAAR